MKMPLLLWLLVAASLGACSSQPKTDTGEASTVQARKASVAAPPAAVRGDYAGYPAAARLIDKLAREEGFDRAYLEQVLSRVERKQWILDFVNRPKAPKSTGPTGAWTRYRANVVNSDNIASGAAFWDRYADHLARAQTKYGVPPEYIVGIVGIETRYGGYTGKHRVIDALATLAFDYPRRSEFFTGELEAFLIMSRDEGFDPFAPMGSYAGAMGLGQFMPTSFQQWAVDFDGDGKRDLWHPVDAIGSVANYFASHGWRQGEPVTIRATRMPAGRKGLETGYDTRYSLDDLRRLGILAVGSTPTTLGSADRVSLIELDGADGYEYWLGFDNFYVITRYNHSSYYAMAVHQLAQAVRARHDGGSRVARAGPRG